MSGNMNNTGGVASAGKPNQGSNIIGLSQQGNGGPGVNLGQNMGNPGVNIGGQQNPQNKDDKSWLLLCSALTDGPYSYI